MAYNPFDDIIDNDPAYMANGGPLQVTVGGSEDAKRGVDYLRKSGQSIEGYTIPQLDALGKSLKDPTPSVPTPSVPTPSVPKFISEGRDIRRRQDQLERINNLKFPSSAYQKVAKTLEPLTGEELDEYNDQFYTKPRFTGVTVGDVGNRMYNFLGKGTGPEVQEQMDLNKEILERNTYGLPSNVIPGSREANLTIKENAEEIMESLKEQGYDDINVGRFLQNMFFGDQKQAYNAMDEGTAYSDLPDPLKSAANPFWLLLDSVDALTLGAGGLLLAGGRKLTPKFINFLKNAKRTKMADVDIITEAKRQFPNEYTTIVTSNNNALEEAGIPVRQVLQRQADMPGGSPGVSPKPSKRLKSQQADMLRLVKDANDGKIEKYQSTEYYRSKGYNIPLRDSAGRRDIAKLAEIDKNFKEFQILTNRLGPEAQTYEAEKVLKALADNPNVQTVTEAVEMLNDQGFKINASKLNEILGFSQRKRNAPTATPEPELVKKAQAKIVTPLTKKKNLEEGIEKVKSGKIKPNQGAQKTA